MPALPSTAVRRRAPRVGPGPGPAFPGVVLAVLVALHVLGGGARGLGPVLGPSPAAADEPSSPGGGRPDPRSLLTDLRVGVAFQDQLRRSLSADGVVRVFEQLQRGAPDNAILSFLLARARGTKPALEEMRRALERRLGLPATERSQVSVGWFVLARLEAEQGLLDAALTSAGYALRLEPREPVYALLGWIHERRGDRAAAIAAYGAGLALDARAVSSRVALADLLLRSGQVGQALPLARGTLVLAPRSALAQLYWGTALSMAGNAEDGRRAYQRALRLADGDPDAVTTIAAALRRMDGQALAYDALARAAAAHPGHRGVLLQLAGLEIETGRGAEAGARLDRALKSAPDDAPLWYLRGLAHDALRAPRESAGAYARAARLDPARLEYRLAHGAALQRAGDGRQALLVYRAAAQRFPDEPRARDYHARILLEQNQATEAAEEFEVVARLRPDDPDPCYVVAVVRGARLGQQGEARAWLERYVALGGKEPAALRWLEDLRRALGR